MPQKRSSVSTNAVNGKNIFFFFYLFTSKAHTKNTPIKQIFEFSLISTIFDFSSCSNLQFAPFFCIFFSLYFSFNLTFSYFNERCHKRSHFISKQEIKHTHTPRKQQQNQVIGSHINL